MITSLHRCTLVLAACATLALRVDAQGVDPSAAMHWREIGPTRAGRARALAGVPSQPNVFYIGFDNGGVWRSTDYGSNWVPLFDSEPTGSIGAIAVAPSDPNVIYVGTGAGIIRPDLAIGRRHLQVHRRREDVDAPRPARQPDDREDRRRPEESEPAVRRGARPSVRTERRARHLPLDRRRPDLREGALQGRVHERQRRPDRSERSEHRLRDALAAAAELHRGRRVRRRAANGIFKSTDGGTTWKQLDRRAAADPRRRTSRSRRAIRTSSTRWSRQRRAGRRRWGGRRTRRRRAAAVGRLLQIDRRRRRTGSSRERSECAGARRRASQDRRPLARIGGGDLPTHRRRSEERERRLQLVDRVLAHRGRRPDVVGRARRARRRRLSEDVDQSEQPEHHPRRRRPGRASCRPIAASRGATGTRSPPRRCIT